MPVESEAFAKATQLVQEEQRAYLSRNGDSRLGGYFNNWCLNLPNPDFQPGGGVNRQLCLELDIWDMTQRENYRQKGEQPSTLYSDRYLDRVIRDFFGDIDEALADQGMDLARIIRLQQLSHVQLRRFAREMTNVARGIVREREIAPFKRDYGHELHMYTQPAFIQLRAMGYSLYDLTA